MKICEKCSKSIDDNMLFCPYCGEKVVVETPPENAVVNNIEPSMVREKMSKKKLVAIAFSVMAVIMVVGIIICEVKISSAERLYRQGEYFKAWSIVREMPALGRENIIRIKTAGYAAEFYETYLHEKQRLSSAGSKDEDAYRDAFWELIFGLHINLKDIQNNDLNDIEKDEYQKFINLQYDELSSVFSMSMEEADDLLEEFRQIDESQEMKDIVNKWLDFHFFSDYLDIDVYFYLSKEEREEVRKQFASDGIDMQEAKVIAQDSMKMQEGMLYLAYGDRKNNYELTTTDVEETENSYVYDFYGTFDVYDEYLEIDKRFKFHKYVEVSRETGDIVDSEWTLEER